MKKIILYIEETLEYSRRMVIEVPGEMSEDELNEILDVAQMKAYGADEVPFIIEQLNNNIKIVEMPDDNFNSPHDSHVEVVDFDYVD